MSHIALKSMLPGRIAALKSGFSVSHRKRSTETFSKLLYPLAQNAPEIAQTQAAEAAATESTTKPFTPDRKQNEAASDDIPKDPFDDSNSLSSEEHEQIRTSQKSELSTSLSSRTLPILASPPAHIPANVPANELETPVPILTTLDNGMRVISQETYGQVTTVGLVSQFGSLFEKENEVGSSALLQTLGFGTSQNLGSLEINQCLQDWGGVPLISVGREQALHAIDLLRPNAEHAVALLAEAMLRPQFLKEEIDDVLRTIEFQAEDMPPEILVMEAMQAAAYGTDQALGRPHFPTQDFTPNLTSDIVAGFWERQFVNNPQGLVIGATGIEHDRLLEYIQRYFGGTPVSSPPPSASTPTAIIPPATVYRGGQVRQIRPWKQEIEDKDLVRISIGVPTQGWHGEHLVATCVLQMLLGGGQSFSAGGPGKGMYSRLYRQVLNSHGWAESAEAWTAFSQDTGLWGISGSAPPRFARDLSLVLTDHILTLGNTLVTDEELSRARTMLKNNVLSQLESRVVLFEDLSRQILTYGYREDIDQMCAKIDAITAEDIRNFVNESLQSPPSIASVGSDLSKVPEHAELSRWFGN